MSSKSLYETFGNEVSYEQRRGKLVQFIENNTINFPLPEASIEILVNMIPGDFKGIDPSKVEIIENRLTSIGFTGPTAKTLASAKSTLLHSLEIERKLYPVHPTNCEAVQPRDSLGRQRS